MTDERPEAALDPRTADLVDAGLVTVTTDDDGRERLALTEAGEELGRTLANESDYDPDEALARLLSEEEARAVESSQLRLSRTEPLTLRESFGTALGSAMLGFEQALRREPPAEIIAAEHEPERGYSGEGSPVVIEFPDDRGPAPPKLEPTVDDPTSDGGD